MELTMWMIHRIKPGAPAAALLIRVETLTVVVDSQTVVTERHFRLPWQVVTGKPDLARFDGKDVDWLLSFSNGFGRTPLFGMKGRMFGGMSMSKSSTWGCGRSSGPSDWIKPEVLALPELDALEKAHPNIFNIPQKPWHWSSLTVPADIPLGGAQGRE